MAVRVDYPLITDLRIVEQRSHLMRTIEGHFVQPLSSGGGRNVAFLKASARRHDLASCAVAFKILWKGIDTGPIALRFADGVAAETVCFGLSKPRATRFNNGPLDVNRRQWVEA